MTVCVLNLSFSFTKPIVLLVADIAAKLQNSTLLAAPVVVVIVLAGREPAGDDAQRHEC